MKFSVLKNKLCRIKTPPVLPAVFLFGKTKLIGAQRFFQIIKVVSETFLFSLDFGIGIVHLQFNGIGLFLLSLFSGGFLCFQFGFLCIYLLLGFSKALLALVIVFKMVS